MGAIKDQRDILPETRRKLGISGGELEPSVPSPATSQKKPARDEPPKRDTRRRKRQD